MYICTAGFEKLQTRVKVTRKQGGTQETIAEISMQAELGEKGRRYSQNVACDIIASHLEEISASSFLALLEALRKGLAAKNVRLSVSFPYFIRKKAPVSGTPSLMEYGVRFSGSSSDKYGFISGVTVPITTLCPCSKEISEAGAHNQRAEVKLDAAAASVLWAEDLIQIVENSASCELYALLKRPDEKYVTERAYNRPMFVEDVVRKVSVAAKNHPDISWFSVSVESFESIHNHNAYAYVDSVEA